MNRRLLAALVATALALATWVNSLFPSAESAYQRPFEFTATAAPTVGKPEVLDVQGFSEINGVSTTAVFLAVGFRTIPGPDFLALDTELTDGQGRALLPFGRSENCSQGEPGVALECVVFFEVEPSAVPGSELRVRSTPGESGTAVAVVDLCIDEDRAAAIVDNAAPVTSDKVMM